jgi:6-pyruvoyltetrahydropterin/6-carboxytetrahydropterin synthase
VRVELTKLFSVEAAHRNPQGGGGAARLHGHSFRIEVIVAGEIDPVPGWLIDYGEIKRCFHPIFEQLDHRYLNEISGLEDATLGDIAAWIESRLEPVLPHLQGVRVSVVGDNTFVPVELPAEPDHNLPARLRFSFEAAQQLPQLPEGHPCRRLHGHSYRIEAGADDLGRLLEPLREIYTTLDHRYLNDIPGLETATSERLCAWVWERLSQAVDNLRVVIVQETESARCTYYGD